MLLESTSLSSNFDINANRNVTVFYYVTSIYTDLIDYLYSTSSSRGCLYNTKAENTNLWQAISLTASFIFKILERVVTFAARPTRLIEGFILHVAHVHHVLVF